MPDSPPYPQPQPVQLPAGFEHLAAAYAGHAASPSPSQAVAACTTCGAAPTSQWLRPATADEAAAHWDALESNIRACGNPDYVQDRTDPVHVTVLGCDDHTDPAAAG